MIKVSLLCSLLIMSISNPITVWAGNSCTYSSYKWNTKLKKAVQRVRLSKPYHEVTQQERDPLTGCSVCEEDQVTINMPGVKPFRLCRVFATDVKQILLQQYKSGFPFYEIVGYRPGMTRGSVDVQGNRTRFSNHSFGIAVDINPQQNGLYDRCLKFGAHCRLIRGGIWKPNQSGSLRHDGALVKAMQAIGFRWGGLILGRQKDFMHFSPYGY